MAAVLFAALPAEGIFAVFTGVPPVSVIAASELPVRGRAAPGEAFPALPVSVAIAAGRIAAALMPERTVRAAIPAGEMPFAAVAAERAVPAAGKMPVPGAARIACPVSV